MRLGDLIEWGGRRWIVRRMEYATRTAIISAADQHSDVIPDDLDKRVARLKLESMGIKIDRLTPEQEEYLAGWSEGT